LADPYAAMHFVAAHHSVMFSSEAGDFYLDLTRISKRQLTATTRGAANRLGFVDSFKLDALFVCHSSARVRRLHTALVRIDSQAARLVSLAARGRALEHAKEVAAARAARQARIAAENAWHQGYNQQDYNVYWKWLDGHGCAEYALDGCWNVEVITRDGCPTYLGVEANEYQGNAVVGDLLGNNGTGIPPKTPAIIELDADASSDTANNVKIECD